MPKARYLFAAPLSHARGHFRSVHLVHPFKVERWPTEKLIRLWRQLEALPKIEIVVRAEQQHCFDRGDKTAHLITATVDLPFTEPSADDALVDHYRTLDPLVDRLHADIRSIRLFLCSDIKMVGAYWYRLDQRMRPEMIASEVIQHPVTFGGTSVNNRIAPKLNAFIADRRTPLKRDYLKLAWDHWDQSFGTFPEHREFLSLMTSLEAMFNIGEAELKYRIARSMAVLLGSDLEESDEIFDAIKKAYDIRSRLIHTGNTDRLKELWVWSLRGRVNEALRKLIELNVDKTALSELLTRLPFGLASSLTTERVARMLAARNNARNENR